MKTRLILSIAALTFQSAYSATTVEWGSLIPSTIVDSSGVVLDEEAFTFQLGFFRNTFTPTEENISQWSSNWAVFDQAVYNESEGWFTSNAGINGDGTSTSVAANPLGLNYEGEQAYVWAFNSQTPGTGTEWFLATASNWVFPEGNDDCCDTSGNVQWSLSDLDTQSPVWGAQNGQVGAGDYQVTSPNYDLQTFAAIPEPSSLLLLAMGVCGLVTRRKRNED